MDFLALGAIFFLVVVAFSVGLEIQDRYQEVKDPDGRFRLLPRRNYYELHGEVYNKPALPPTPQAPGTFQIKREERPVRCEICHQSDMFDANTSHCSRCNHTTA